MFSPVLGHPQTSAGRAVLQLRGPSALEGLRVPVLRGWARRKNPLVGPSGLAARNELEVFEKSLGGVLERRPRTKPSLAGGFLSGDPQVQ